MTLRPLGSWVLLKDIESPHRSRGGIHFPRKQMNDTMPTMTAKVEAIGRKVETVQPGETVVVQWSEHLQMDPYEKTVLSMFPEKMRLIEECKILGVLHHA